MRAGLLQLSIKRSEGLYARAAALSAARNEKYTEISPEVAFPTRNGGESACITLGRSISRHIRIKREIDTRARVSTERSEQSRCFSPKYRAMKQRKFPRRRDEKRGGGGERARHTAIDFHEVTKEDQTRETLILPINLESFLPTQCANEDQVFLYSLKSLFR